MTLFLDVAKLAAQYDFRELLFWDEALEPSIICNDIFSWGAADLEPLTPEKLIQFEELQQAHPDFTGPDIAILLCAKLRGTRPQNAMYLYIEEEKWPIFDACGPERSPDKGSNPYPIPGSEAWQQLIQAAEEAKSCGQGGCGCH